MRAAPVMVPKITVTFGLQCSREAAHFYLPKDEGIGYVDPASGKKP